MRAGTRFYDSQNPPRWGACVATGWQSSILLVEMEMLFDLPSAFCLDPINPKQYILHKATSALNTSHTAHFLELQLNNSCSFLTAFWGN